MSLCRAALGFLLLLVVCLVCVGSPQTHAQQKVPAPASQTPPIRVTTSLVLVDVLVEDKKTGEPIKDLEEKDFLLHDDRKAASISGFSSGKNQNLRPLQLWFVMACNEARLYPVTTGRVTQDQRTEILGGSFLAGKAAELLHPALEHLGTDETAGVAHWCDNGESTIDLMPTLNRDTLWNAIEEIAGRKRLSFEQMGYQNNREHALRLINDVARSAFPVPFTAIVFIGEKGSGAENGKPAGASPGAMDFSSLDYGIGGGDASNDAGNQSRYSVENNDYGQRLGIIIDILHSRYEIGFVPGKQGKKLHYVSLALAEEAKQRYPNALLRYRSAYNDETPSQEVKSAKGMADWKHLDSTMQAAVKSAPSKSAIALTVSEASSRALNTRQFIVNARPEELTWKTLPSGDRRSIVTAVVASYSAKGQLIAVVVKDLEIIQESDRLPVLREKPVAFSVNAETVKGAVRIRLVVRDVASGRIGFQDLHPVTPIDRNEKPK